MVSNIRKVVISIGGGHATGTVEQALQIKKLLSKHFAAGHNIKIINLDEQVEGLAERTYSCKDYDLDGLYAELSSGFKSENELEKVDSGISGTDNIELVVVCGCYALFDEKINKLSKLKVYLDSDADKRLINLIRLNNVNSSQELSTLLTGYLDHLRVEMQKYIEPTRVSADLIIPSSNDTTGCAIIVDGIMKVVEELKGSNNSDVSPAITNGKNLFSSLLNFEAERMEVQKSRYYDLA